MTITPPIHRLRSTASRLAEQEITLADGESALTYADLAVMANAVAVLGSRHLPTKEARIHVARCRRLLKPHLDERDEERQRIQTEHAPVETGDTIGEGDRVQFRDALGMTRELAELDHLIVAVRLPRRITDAMLPVNDKAHPNNEDGLGMLLADLGPLYAIEDEANDAEA